MKTVAAPAKGAADHWGYWLPWVTSFCAIALPAGALLFAAWFVSHRWTDSAVAVSFRRGDFIVPALIPCVATVVQWWREVARSPAFFKWIGGFITVVSVLAVVGGLLALGGAGAEGVTTNSGLTPATASSVEDVTWVCLAPGLAFGLLAAGLLSAGRRRDR